MKTKIFSLLIFLVFAVFAANAQTTFNDGLSKGKSSNKKILINVYSDSDTWSQKMDNVYASGNIMNYVNSNFVYVKLNANGSDKVTYNGKEYTSSTLARHFGATGYPSHIVLLPDGSIIKFLYNGESTGVFPGYLDAGDFEKLLKYFAENKYQNSDLNKFF